MDKPSREERLKQISTKHKTVSGQFSDRQYSKSSHKVVKTPIKRQIDVLILHDIYILIFSFFSRR